MLNKFYSYFIDNLLIDYIVPKLRYAVLKFEDDNSSNI